MTRHNPTRKLRVEALEPRDVPSRLFLASWSNPQSGQREIAKFATISNHAIPLSSTPVPESPGGDSWARDVDVTPDGRWVVFNGTTNPSLGIYNPVSRVWKQLTMPDWDLDFFSGSYGGVVTAGRYAFAPDMETSFEDPKGIIRFDLKEMTATRFADTEEYTDLNVGLNGKLYALRGDNGPIDVFDAASMQFETTVTPAAGTIIRGVAANKAGLIFIVDWNENVYKLSPTGEVLDSFHIPEPNEPGFANTHDIDISKDGTQLVVGSQFGWGVQLPTTFAGPLLYFRGASSDLQVSFLEPSPTLPVVPAFRVNDPAITEGHTGTRSLNFSVRLSAPTTRPVTVNYATQDGSATDGTDYTATSGTLTFLPGQMSKTVSVLVAGDLDAELDETVQLVLSDPVFGTLGDPIGVGTIRTDDRPPVAVAGPDRSINEGAIVAFSAAGSSDPDGDTLTYVWDFGDGENSTTNKPAINHQYKDNGEYTATLTVRDSSGLEATDTATITVSNRTPTGGLTGPQATVPGWARPWRFTGVDPGVDDRTSLEFRIDWDDGVIQTVIGGPLMTVGHAYDQPGTYTVLLRVKDKDGAQSVQEYHRNIVVKPLHVEAGTVYLPGTLIDDAIEVRSANATGTSFTVAIDDQIVGSWAASGLTIFGRDGNDTVTTVGVISRRLIVDGGAGNDTIDVESATGPNVLIGGLGTDILRGGSGRDVLIGGAGADILDGRGNDDLLLGAGVSFQTDTSAVKAVSAEWTRTIVSYEKRRDRLLGIPPTGLNGKNVLTATTVVQDAASDSLAGREGDDWFFNSAATPDDLVDHVEEETVTIL